MNDREARRQLARVLNPVPAWAARFDAPLVIESGSSLAADAAPNSGLWPIGHLVNGSMLTAVDHLRCLTDSLRSGQLLYIMAYDSLVRSAIVSACQSVWLLSGDTRTARRHRALLVYRDDWKNRIAIAKNLKGSKLAKAEDLEAEIDKLDRRMATTAPILAEYQRALGPGTAGEYQMTSMVKDAARHVFPDELDADDEAQLHTLGYGLLVSLSHTSAVVHASPRSVVARAERDQLIDMGDGTSLARFSMDIPTFFQHTAGAVLVLNEAWRLFDLRRVRQV